jgi:rhamnulokinase
MTFRHCVAVDLGASSGRVMLASWTDQRTLTLREIHRFTNCLQKVDGFDCWDIDSLKAEIRPGWKSLRAGHPDRQHRHRYLGRGLCPAG